MIVPALLTLGTGAVLYAFRGPQSQLTQGQRYRIVANVTPDILFPGVPVDKDAPQINAALSQMLTTLGFSDVKYKNKSTETAAAGSVPRYYTYWFDGTWTRPEKIFPPGVALPPWLGLSWYDTLFGL